MNVSDWEEYEYVLSKCVVSCDESGPAQASKPFPYPPTWIEMNSDVPSSPQPTRPTSTQPPLQASNPPSKSAAHIEYVQYSLALEPQYLNQIRALISKDLSEPYSIYVYRYFLYQWPELCFLALDTSKPLPAPDSEPAISPATSSPAPPSGSPTYTLAAVIISKLEPHPPTPLRGYIAMLATSHPYRHSGHARTLVLKSLSLLSQLGAYEIALETEESNLAAMALYEGLGFVRSKKLYRYYLNGNSAFRFLLGLRENNYSGRGRIDGEEWNAQDQQMEKWKEEIEIGRQDLLARGIV